MLDTPLLGEFFLKYFVNLLEIAEIASLAIDGSEMVQIFFFFFFFFWFWFLLAA